MSRDFQLVLVDSYLADEAIFRTLRQAFEISVAIDDFDRISYEVDLVLCPNASFKKVGYPSGGVARKIVGGPSLVIIRRSIHELRHVFKVREEICKVLITVGGHDTHNLIPPIIRLLVDDFDGLINKWVQRSEQFRSTVDNSLNCKYDEGGKISARGKINDIISEIKKLLTGIDKILL